MVVVKEYETMLEAYGKAGGNLDALKSKQVGNLGGTAKRRVAY